MNYTALAGVLVARLENIYATLIYRIRSQNDIVHKGTRNYVVDKGLDNKERKGRRDINIINISIHYRLRKHSLFSDSNSK